MMARIPNILLVEDSETQAQQIASQMSQYDIQVIIASDGAQGLRLLYIEQPDLIVLDVHMPKMDGYQMCRRIRRDPETAHIPVIMLTAADSDEEISAGLEAGADGYITKDQFAADNLMAALCSYGLLEETTSTGS